MARKNSVFDFDDAVFEVAAKFNKKSTRSKSVHKSKQHVGVKRVRKSEKGGGSPKHSKSRAKNKSVLHLCAGDQNQYTRGFRMKISTINITNSPKIMPHTVTVQCRQVHLEKDVQCKYNAAVTCGVSPFYWSETGQIRN